jgi:hypothetical protein
MLDFVPQSNLHFQRGEPIPPLEKGDKGGFKMVTKNFD